MLPATYSGAMANLRPKTGRQVERMPVSGRDVVTASALAVATITLVWWLAVPWGPIFCPAIYPAPTNCVSTYREGTAVVVTIVVALVFAITILLAFTVGRHRRGLVLAGVMMLGLALVASWPLVAALPGFPIR